MIWDTQEKKVAMVVRIFALWFSSVDMSRGVQIKSSFTVGFSKVSNSQRSPLILSEIYSSWENMQVTSLSSSILKTILNSNAPRFLKKLFCELSFIDSIDIVCLLLA